MISKELEKTINFQINRELFSEYLYLGMSAYFSEKALDGFANFFKVQAQEEHFHMEKLFNYLLERGGKVGLETIEAPEQNFSSAVDVFEKALAHEVVVTKLINNLMSIALKNSDHAAVSFLNWFVDEQVEEEASMESILQKLKLADGNGYALLMLDKEYSTRSFTPPVE